MNDRNMPRQSRSVSDEQILELFEQHDDPFLAAIEVSDWFGLTRQWAHNRLQRLHDEGRLEKKKAGPSSVIWYLEP